MPVARVSVRTDTTRDLGTEVQLRDVVLDRSGELMTVWIYSPRKPAAPAKQPVILIAAAGSPLIWGMALSDGDRAEHLPWVERGYTVVAYSLDGNVVNDGDVAEQRLGISSFLRARAGFDNAKAALDFALRSHPALDATRVFSVGHSSAGTLALRVGAEDARIKATIAFAPATDVDRYVAASLPFIDTIDEKGRAILHASSPMSFVVALRKKPAFLFHAADDDVVPTADVRALFEAMAPVEAHSKLVTVSSGGHYESMINAGIPAAAAWIGQL